MGLQRLLTMTGREMSAALRNADRTLDVIVHPGFSVYFQKDYARISDHPLLHGAMDSCIREMLLPYGKYLALEGVEPLLFSKGGKRRVFGKTMSNWRKSLSLLRTALHYVQGADLLNEAMSIIELSRRRAPAVFVLPKGYAACSPFRSYMDFLSDGVDTFMAVESSSWNDGYLFDRGSKKFHCLVPLRTAKKGRRMSSLSRLLKDYSVDTIRLWGGFINQCLLGTQRSLAMMGGAKVYVDLQKSSVYKVHNRDVYVSHFPGTINHQISYHDSLQTISDGLNALLNDPPAFDELEGAIGKGVFYQYQMFKSYKELFTMKDRFKHCMAIMHPNVNRGPMLRGTLLPVSLSPPQLSYAPSARFHHI